MRQRVHLAAHPARGRAIQGAVRSAFGRADCARGEPAQLEQHAVDLPVGLLLPLRHLLQVEFGGAGGFELDEDEGETGDDDGPFDDDEDDGEDDF